MSPEVHKSRGTPPESSSPHPEDEEITDWEWELRTGRAIYVLQETLPTFFDVGLVTAVDKTTGAPKPPSSTAAYHFHLPLLDTHPSSLLAHEHGPSGNGKTKRLADDLELIESGEEEQVYSSNICLEYTPPVPLPTPFPKTFKVEGIQLYLASSVLIRHAMNALYSDLTVTLTKVSVHTNPPPTPPGSGDSFSALNASSLQESSCNKSPMASGSGFVKSEGEYTTPSRKKEKKSNREKYLVVRQLVNGVTRVSGKEAQWEVESMYTCSPISGLIWKHRVNSIHPAPHLSVYDALKFNLGKVFGFGQPVGPTVTPTASAVGSTRSRGQLDGK